MSYNMYWRKEIRAAWHSSFSSREESEERKKMGRSHFPDTGGARIEDIEEKEMAEIFGQKQEVFW